MSSMKTAFLEKLSPSLPKLDKGITIGYFPFFSSIIHSSAHRRIRSTLWVDDNYKGIVIENGMKMMVK